MRAATLKPVWLTAFATVALAAADPDTLTLTSGEKLIGHLERSTGTSVKFKSDGLGEITVDWSKIKELHAGGQWAVIPKNVKLKPKAPLAVPEGTIAEADQKITVTEASATKTVDVKDTADVIDKSGFEKAMGGGPGFFQAWTGKMTAGAAFVEATQASQTFSDALTLLRILPGEDWLARRSKTSADFSSSYGTVSQPGSPTVKTSIYHADAERDDYYSPKAYGFAQTSFDHNYSQGLGLQQNYSGGLGWSAIAKGNENLDLKAGLSFVHQEFSGTTPSMSLAGSVFDEKFLRKFHKNAAFTQEFSVSPSWTNSQALSALASAAVSLPVWKRVTYTLGVTDNYLRDPAPGFRKNSVQITTGFSYSLR